MRLYGAAGNRPTLELMTENSDYGGTLRIREGDDTHFEMRSYAGVLLFESWNGASNTTVLQSTHGGDITVRDDLSLDGAATDYADITLGTSNAVDIRNDGSNNLELESNGALRLIADDDDR